MTDETYLIVGAGLAAHQAALQLKKSLPNCSVTLLGNEKPLPYDRPPLSKAFLVGSAAETDLVLDGAIDYQASGISYIGNSHVTNINKDKGCIYTQDGTEYRYDKLLLATGSRPRKLPEHVVGNAHVNYLRTVEDAKRLRFDLKPGNHLAVIGGGVLGLEAAASARALGCEVTIIEAAPRLAARTLPPKIAQWLLDIHRSNGASVFLSANVVEVSGSSETNFEIRIDTGDTFHANSILAAIGILPNCELAAEAGIDVNDGIIVDKRCRTSDSRIFAAGEVTRHPCMPDGQLRRIEAWHTSSEHGKIAAKNMACIEEDFLQVPWFWSDQYTYSIQSVGVPNEGAEFQLIGDTSANSWALTSLNAQGETVGAIGINNGRVISQIRAKIARMKQLPREAYRNKSETTVMKCKR